MEIFDSSSESDEEVEEPIRGRTFRPRINFDSDDFEEKFRLKRATVEEILQRIGGELLHPTQRNKALTPNHQLLDALRFFATNGVYNLVAVAHGPSPATLCRTIKRVVNSINANYFDSVIKWAEKLEVPANLQKILSTCTYAQCLWVDRWNPHSN